MVWNQCQLGKLEDVNEVIVTTVEDVKDFAVEKMEDFKRAVIETEASQPLEIGKNVELASSKLKETKMEEMEEEVKRRLRHDKTFENSVVLSRVGGRQFIFCAPRPHQRAGEDADADALC